ncbi:MAG: hypothetical protein CL927_12545 [Deltaproteobacteria bacterium]|nr:hypothetical protein [Deltaproteobacteria bacterium]HCH62658.1 hypothetical protein [Deltaproteobacteria bacterium]
MKSKVCTLGLLLTSCGAPSEGSVVGGCANGLDDDGNGSLDCADASCVNAPVCAVEEEEPASTDTGLAAPPESAPPTDSGGSDTGDAAPQTAVDESCNANSMRVTLPEGQGSADFDAFVWTLDDDELVVAGLQTGGEDGCTAVTDIESQPGYLLEIDVVGTPAAGDVYAIVFDANDPLQAEVRFENLGTSIAEVSAGEGSLTIVGFDPEGALEISGFSTTLNGGSTILDGSFTACPCDRIPE